MSTVRSGTLAHVHDDIDRILIDRNRIADRIEELGAEIRADLHALDGDLEIILVPVLTGAIIFVADLMRQLPQKMRINVMSASSYPGTATKSRGVPQLRDVPDDLAGKFVLIIDDILDSGRTITTIRAAIEAHGPTAVRTCVLLRKELPAAMNTPCEYVGFDIPDEFVVGYGLDYNDLYRNLPDVGVLKPEVVGGA